MAYHYAFDSALVRGDDVISLERHWATIAVILKGSRTGAGSPKRVIKVEVHGRNSP